MDTALLLLAALFVLGTALPILEHDRWWIRALDFPRLQIALSGIALLGLYLAFWDTGRVLEDMVLGAFDPPL